MRLFRMAFVVLLVTACWCALRWEQAEAPVLLTISTGGRPATLTVANSSCQPAALSDGFRCEANGRLTTDDGLFTDRVATLRGVWSVQPELSSEQPLRVAATVPVNDSLRAVPLPESDDWVEAVRMAAGPTLRWLEIAWALIVGLYLLDFVGSLLRPWGRSRVQVVVGVSSVGCAGFLLGLGVPLLLGATTGLEAGQPWAWGLGLSALALLMPVERFVVFDRSRRTVSTGWRYLLLRWTRRAVEAGEFQRVVIESKEQNHRLYVSTSRAGRVLINQSPSLPQLETLGAKISAAIGVRVGEEKVGRRRGRGERATEAADDRAAAVAAPPRPEPHAVRSVTSAEPHRGSDAPLITVVGDGASMERVAPLLGCGCLVLLLILGGLWAAGVVDVGAWFTSL